MSKAQRRAWEIRPDDCAVIRTSLLSKHLSSEIHPRPSELADDKKALALCVAQGLLF